ncbi:MAG: Caa(3)-type oxidase subunit IV [Rhizobacter sp.]|nr:Caa(3)-type oxidase subunit IV [Rhizobacter sp.]
MRQELRRLAAAWAALIALMLLSLGSAYLPLHGLNAAVGLGIALAKAGIVVALFMRLARASGMVRLVAATALFAWCVGVGLSGVDFATRRSEPAAMQQPQQREPLRGDEAPR